MRHNYFNLNQNASKNDGQVPRNVQMSRYCPQPDSVSNPCRCRDLATPRVFSAVSSARAWKHVAMIFAVLVMSIGNVWGTSAVNKDTGTSGTIIYSNINSDSKNSYTITAVTDDNGLYALTGNISLTKSYGYMSMAENNIFAVCVDNISAGTIYITMAGTGTPTEPDFSSNSNGSDGRYLQLYIDASSAKKYLYTKYEDPANLTPDENGITKTSSGKIRGSHSLDFTSSDLTTISTKKYLKFKVLGGEFKPYGFKIVESAPSCTAPSSVSVGDQWLAFVGEPLTLTASLTGGSGDHTYQWYKGGTSDGYAIEGATSATYYKAEAEAGDADNYYCKVSTEGDDDVWSEAYKVQVLRLQLMWSNGAPVSDYTFHNFKSLGGNKATVSIPLEAYNYSYYIIDGFKACGNSGTIQRSNYTGTPWIHNVSNQRTGLNCDKAGTYIFTIDYSNYSSWQVSVGFPEDYYYKGNEDGWSSTHAMDVSCDGSYAYYWAKGKNSLNALDKGNNNNFLIVNSAGTSTLADGNKLEIRDGESSGFGGTDIWGTGHMGKWDGETNASIYNENDFYIIVFFPKTYVNTTSSPKICASTKLPDTGTTADELVYFDNSESWSNVYYRIGHKGYNDAEAMTAVPGTARLYKMTTDAWAGYEAWNIANNKGNYGSHSIYDITTNTITGATNYFKCEEDGNITILLDGVHNTESGCTYYNVNTYSGMLTHTATVSDMTNGSVRLDWTDVSNTAQNASSTTSGLAHTCNLQITGVPDTGYDVATLTVNGSNFTSGDTHVLSADATIAATFSPQTYSITLNKGEHGAADQSATVAYDATTLTSITHVTPNTGYTLTGYYDGETKVLNASGTFAGANVSGYITSSKWTKATDCTLTAKWECVSLTVNLGGDAATPAGGSPIGTEYTLTCSASTGVIASYQWKQNTTASTTGAVNAEGTGATTASFSPVPAAAGTYYYYCVATDACGNSVNTSFSGVFQFNEPADPCSEPTKVANEIARFFVPCGTSTAAAWSTTADASTGDNSFTTSGFGGTGNNWYTNATSGLIYGKFQSSTYIIIKLKSGSFQAGDVVTAYFNLNSGTKTGLKLKDKDSGNSFEPTASASDVETSGTYTLKAADIENDGSIKFFRTNSSTYVNRIIVTRPPVAATITATKTSPDYVSPDPNNLVLSISTTGASSGWYYRVKKVDGGYQDPDNTPYNTATWTMTSGLVLGANNFVVELYDGSHVKQAESATITVTAETAYPMTIAAGAGGSVSPSGEIKANESGNHIHPEITATPSSGYHFVNWTKNNENATLANANAATTTITNASGACTITANFEADATLYTVTFNSNGGSSVDAITQASEDASITMPAAPTYTGHTFQGWVIGGTTYDPEDPYTPEANVTAYATWKENCAGGGGGSTTLISITPTITNDNKNNGSASASGTPGGTAYWDKMGTSSPYKLNNNGAYFALKLSSGYYQATDVLVINGADKAHQVYYGSHGAGTLLGTTSNPTNGTINFILTGLPASVDEIYVYRSSDTYNGKLSAMSVTRAGGGGGTCYYVTYDGNGADGGSVSDENAYTSGTNVTVLGNVDNPAAFTKTDYRFNGWNTADNGSGTSYAADGTIEGISGNVTLYAQWVLDACSAPAAPAIIGTASRTIGQNIELTATCASGADGSTTYTWYKGVDWATASVASPVQAAMTAGEGGRTFTKATCDAGDAGKYWCEASNGTGCEAHNETGFTVTVSAAVEEHIYYYKDANHYSEGTYSNPEGNTAASGDNKSLSSPWMICNGCKAGVDSVVARGATYDGKGNYMNAYIKLPTGGDASTKNIKFALTAGYTGTLSMKIGGYESNPTVSLKLNGEGDAINYTGTIGGVATTENPGGGTGKGSFNTITWNLSTAGGTYILTVSSANAYISQIDMTTTPTATFNVSYDGNGKTGGTVPSDDTDYAANTSVTVQAQGTMVKDNYTFGGWNTANNGTGTNYVAGSGTFSIKGATTLYAHWTQTINLAPGAKGTGSLGATVSWNGTAVRGFTAHTAAGYSLTGYYTATSGGTKVLNADGSFAATNIDGYITDGKWSRTGAAATLYAQWSGSAIVTNTLGVGSSSKWSSAISTTAPLQITSLSALAAVGGLNIVDEKGTSASDRALTCKVGASGATTKTDGKYLQLSFSIAAGYKLRVTGLDVTVRSVSKAGKYHLELEGTTGSLIPDDEQVASGAVNTIFDDAYNVELTGDVTLKLWAYGKDGSNLMEYYRLGSPIAIYGAVEESCTPPTFSGLDYSATEYTQPASASAISVTGAENVDSYQWKYSAVNDRTSGTNCGTGASVTPSTASTGTLYYWCELTNGCTTVKTPTVAITVSASASNPSVTWSDVKLNGAATTVNYGGGKYELRATVNETTWSGTLESSMVTAPAGIYIHNIGTGTEAGKKYIEFQFDVTTAFDREANDKIGFHLSLPAISGTPNWNALTSDKLVTYEACDEGEGGMIYLPLTETQTTAASGMKYYWETAGSGRLASQYGGSAMGSTLAAAPYRTADYDFPRYAASTGDKWMFQTYVGGVNKIRVVFRAGGALKSSNLTISKFLYDTEYFSSQGDRQVSIGEVSPSKASFASGEDGYMEFTVPEMAANSYAYFQTGSSNIKIYGIVLYSESSGSGGSVETDPTWSDGLNKNGSSVVDKNQGDPNFTYTISTTTNTLGGITYSSSNPSVAEVNATTGEVRITATGTETQTAVITATLARSGCYQPATRTYTVRVAGQECTITSAGTLTADKTSKCESDNVVLSLSGHDTDGTTVTWYRGETNVTGSVSNNTLTTSTAGAYSVVVSKSGCSLRSNTVNITDISAATSATKIVDKWYIKNGRLTPDIALWRLDEGTTFTGVSWSPENTTGLNQEGDIYVRNGVVYLTGKAPGTNATDKEYTLTLTIADACGTPHVLTDKTITIIHQKNTDKHVLAFVVGNTEKNGDKYVAIGKGFTESIPASQTTNVGLYNEIAKNFDVQATNIYSTDDEQKIKEYYSQFDIICITDYPNTKTKGSHSVSYSDAIGVMVDIRPVLTMEAWVSGLANWNKKGISGDPKSPTTRQYTMLLQCKDHEIFAGTMLTEIGEGDDKMYRIHMVDETQHPYDTLDANYGSGTHESKKGYRYGSYPALQGFTFSQAMEDADLLPLGLIDDGAGNDLQVGLERQHEMSARMMVLGINSTAMERLTADGQTVVINALKYLMKKNAEEIADCSTSFVGGAENDETNWMNADNWTGNTVPDKTQKVRILAPCVVPEGEKPHVAGVLIAPNDGGTYNGGSTPTNGSLTIAAGGALIVDGKVEAVTAPAYNRPRATAPADLTIGSTETNGNGTLIFDNEDGSTQAIVEYYSKATTNEASSWSWQYMAVPFNDNSSAYRNYYDSYLYRWAEDCSGWEIVPNRGEVYPWVGYTITQVGAKTYVMDGTLVETGEMEFTVPEGKNLVVGNSWTAPIQVKQFEDADFAGMSKNVYLFNTGYDKDGTGTFDKADGRYEGGTYVTIPIHSSPYTGDSLISSLQAFIVYAKTGEGGGTFTLDYDRHVRPARYSDNLNAGPMHAPKRGGAINDKPAVLKVWASGSRYDDRLVVLEREDFSTGLDEGWDGNKRVSGNSSPLIFAVTDNGREAVSAIPTMEGTLIGFWAGEDNEYTLHFEYNEEDELYLLDLDNNTYTPVNSNSTYVFTVPDKKAHNRFILTRIAPDPVATGVEETQASEKPEAKAIKFLKDEKVFIFVNGKLYDATGKIVK